jgi:microcystin-dependent protein
MADPFVAEIRMFGFNFAPTGWAACDGQLMPISQNTALFSLLGTYYGGDGRSTFALPDLQGRSPMHSGVVQGQFEHFLGEAGGSETVTLLQSELPSHKHELLHGGAGTAAVPGISSVLGHSGVAQIYTTAGDQVQVPALEVAGGSNAHNNRQAYLGVQFCIALQGVFPPRG